MFDVVDVSEDAAWIGQLTYSSLMIKEEREGQGASCRP
jgi:hypothetical protein